MHRTSNLAPWGSGVSSSPLHARELTKGKLDGRRCRNRIKAGAQLWHFGDLQHPNSLYLELPSTRHGSGSVSSSQTVHKGTLSPKDERRHWVQRDQVTGLGRGPWVGGGLGTGTQPVVEGTGVQHHIRSSHKHLPHLSSYLQDGNEEVRRVTQKCLKGENCPTQTQCITTTAQVCAYSLVNNTWHKNLPSHSLCLPGFLCSQ